MNQESQSRMNARPGESLATSESSRRDHPRRTLLICLALALLTLTAYWPVWRCDFVRYDDHEYVTENEQIHAGLTWRGVRWAFSTFHAGNWHPVTWLSHMLDCQLYGLKPAGHHVTNLLLHIANTLLLFGVLRRMTGAFWRCAFVAALFALHPLHVESVAWVAERKDMLSTFFWMLTLWAYARYAEAPRGKGVEEIQNPKPAADLAPLFPFSPFPSFYLLAFACFALGLMSKPMLVTLPFVLLLLDYWPLRRFELSTIKHHPAALFRLFLEKLPFFFLSAASSMITLRAQRSGGAIVPTELVPVINRVGNALIAYGGYLYKTIWPADLAVLYPLTLTTPPWQALGAGLFLTVASILVASSMRRRPYLPVGWLWYLGTLVPVIGLLQVGGQSMADRYSYVPLIGVFIMLVWLVADFIAVAPRRVRVIGPVAAAVLLACAGATLAQLRHWRNSEALFRQALSVTRNNVVMYHNLSLTVTNQQEKIKWLETAVRIDPHYAEAHSSLGLALASEGKLDDAIAHYRQAIRFKPKYLDAHNNLGLALKRLGRYDEAMAEFNAALKLNPDSEAAHVNLGGTLLDQGRAEEAMAHLRRALQINTNSALAHNGLGAALDSLGQHQEALAHYQAALRLKPDDADALNNLAAALLDQGKTDEALNHLQAVIRFNSNSADTYNNLGIAFTRRGQISEAIANFEKAIELNPNKPDTHHNLGSLFYDQAKYDKAVTHEQAALQLKPDLISARYLLGKALIALGRTEEAAAAFAAVLQARPDDMQSQLAMAELSLKQGRKADAIKWCDAVAANQPANAQAQFRLGQLLVGAGQAEAAVKHLRAAVRLKPDWLPALNELAWKLATLPDARLRDGKQAVEFASRAVQLTRTNDAVVLDTLAAGLAEAGRFDEAVITAQQAMTIAQTAGQNDLVIQIRKHLEFYHSRRSYQEQP